MFRCLPETSSSNSLALSSAPDCSNAAVTNCSRGRSTIIRKCLIFIQYTLDNRLDITLSIIMIRNNIYNYEMSHYLSSNNNNVS